MDVKLLLCAWTFLCLGGFAVSRHPGTDFAVVFMQNVFPTGSKTHLELLLTSFFPDTRATIRLPRRQFSKVVSLTTGVPTSIELPKKVELLSSARSNMTIQITSNKPISVVAINKRPHSTGVALVSPIFDWGSEYYIMTPEPKLKGSLGQMAIVNGPKPNVISVLLTGLVQLENTTYLPGQQLDLALSPWESVQLQTNQSLTASHLVSQEDVAVFAGLGCVGVHTPCNHVYLQLSATTTWGSNFVVPPLSLAKVNILTAKDTQVTLIRGNDTMDVLVAPGMMQEVKVDPTTSLLISSTEKIMVLLNFGTNNQSSGVLLNLSPIEKACVAYAVISLPGFSNNIHLVIHKDALEGLELDHKPLYGIQWTTIDTTELVYIHVPLSQKSYQFISNAGHDFDLVTVGMGKSGSFAIPGICLDKEYHLCGFEYPNTLCSLLQNMSNCVSLAPPTCMAWGKTHLLTFFGSYMSGSPSCPRILISSKGDILSQRPFSVERDPSSGLTVRIRVFAQVLEISTDKPGVVLVNNDTWYTPISLNDDGLTVTRFGFLASIVNASFGLRVIIGDRGFIHLQIDQRYYASLSGDCVAQSSKEMLNSIGPMFLGAPVGCDPILVEVRELPDEPATANVSNCQIMSESNVFQSCHLTLDPKPFIESCKLDVTNGSSSCSAIEAYALACGINGVQLMEWRNISHCDLQCPLHSLYEGSTNCSASCVETALFTCDSSLLYEACVCDEGYEISVGSCVPTDECGCYSLNSYNPTVDVYYDNCMTRCSCSGLYFQCYQTNGCDEGKTCTFNNGSWFCNPTINSACILYGDAHYITFDGEDYTFNGLCDTRMAGVYSNDTGLEPFEVNLVEEFVWRTSIQAVNISVYGKTITFSPDYNGQVNVDGTLVNTPYVVGTSLQIYKSNLGADTLQTDFGLVVSFNQMKRLLIKVPDSYLGSVYGLCASMINPVSNEPSCVQYCQGICTNCSNEIYLTKATSFCGIIQDSRGPFRDCLQKVDPNPYFEACVNDLCFSFTWCPTLSAYAAACQEAGTVIDPWRDETNCGYDCPLHSTYSTSTQCTYKCPSTCVVSLPLTCQLQCQEGCTCDPGYILSGDTCVLPQNCGCYVNGRYWKSGDIFFNGDQCQKRCYCVDDQIICEDYNCTSEEQCTVVMGVRACYPLLSTCLVSGQSYLTFDGYSYTVNENCLFVMAMVAGTEEVVNFEVDLRMEVLSNSDLASVQKAILNVYGYTIIFNLDTNDLEVNGNLTNFPVNFDNKVFGNENGSHIVLETDFGLQMTFDPSIFSLTIPLAYAGMVGGLCGNANAIPSDDTSGLPIDQFLSTWSLYADNTTCIQIPDDDPSTPAFDVARKYCELLETGGPFTACHVLIDPPVIYHNCMSVNGTGDYLHSICQLLQYYNNECQWAGATVQPWKNKTLCPSDQPSVDDLSPPTSTPLAPVTNGECLSNLGPSACWSLNKTSCLFQTQRSFTWLDGVDFQSSPIECSLSLAKVCINDTALDFFSVSVHYKVLGGNNSAESLHVEVYGLNIVLQWNPEGVVWVNQMPVGLPACLIPSKLQIRLEGLNLILEALNGLIVHYDSNGFILLQLPFLYQRGICGECALKETRIKITSEISKGSGNQCLIHVAMEPWHNNVDGSTSLSYCSMLLEDDGPFSDCHRILNPDHLYGSCQVHVCEERQSGGNGDAAACRDLEEYATLCQLQYGVVKPWRNESFCPFTCPAQGTYALCARTCIQCQSGECSGPCLEGCNCPDGYLWNGVSCVTSDMCMKRFSQTELKYLICDTNYNQISTFRNISSSLEGNGMYDLLRKCDPSAPRWLRVVLNLQPPHFAKLHVFYERSFITINSTLQVWVNGLREVLPVTLAPELYISKGEDVVVLGTPGTMEISFSSSGDLKIEVAETISTELCGACAFGNLFPNDGSISLESWRAEDMSW